MPEIRQIIETPQYFDDFYFSCSSIASDLVGLQNYKCCRPSEYLETKMGGLSIWKGRSVLELFTVESKEILHRICFRFMWQVPVNFIILWNY